MEQQIIVDRWNELHDRAAAVGLTLKTGANDFRFNDVPGSNGAVILNNLTDVGLFLRGYELGYKSSLD